MGAWGVKIFQSDVALDVKEEFKAELLLGKSDEEALKSVLELCRDFVNDMDDQYDFWFAIASYSYELGRLLPEVKDKAISLIDDGGDLERWEGREKTKREAVLKELKAKLLSEQPPRKEFKPLKKKVSPLAVNDIYYFQLNDERFKGKIYYNYYVIVLVDGAACVDFRVRGFPDEYPLIYLKFCTSLPERIEDLDKIPMATYSLHDKEGYIKEDHRVLMVDGFRGFKKKLNYLGNYDFKREDAIGSVYDQHYDIFYKSFKPVIGKDGLWHGSILGWDILLREIDYILGVSFDYYPKMVKKLGLKAPEKREGT
ncbi:MAG: hypothetical protein K6E72_03645 [Saccharofermentans sp.]|nr:hypothetical protein [Saccharofermentans sp.]